MMPSLSDMDTDLLRRWQRGDERAFAELYRKYSIALLKIAYNKISVFPAAEELVQDCFLTFYDKRDEITVQPFIYLRTILKYKVLNYRRGSETKIRFLTNAIEEHEPYENRIFEEIDERAAALQLSTHIKNLPEQCRKVFLMSRQNEYSNKEIAERLGISLKTVEAHISRALKYLRKHFDYHWFWILSILEVLTFGN